MRGPFEIREGGLDRPEVQRLLEDHRLDAVRHSPSESAHALDLESLSRPGVTFWTVWDGSLLVGFGALKQLDEMHGEVKSMRTVSSHLRRGIAASLLEHMLDVARGRGYRRLSLETGSMQAFAPARALYARFGFKPCGPFADYVEDPYSSFMTLGLEEGGQDRVAPETP